MAGKAGSRTSEDFRFFYLSGNLHKLLRVDRNLNLVTAWRFVDEERVVYIWTDVLRNAQRAFSITRAGNMLNVSRRTILRYEGIGEVKKPDRSKSEKENKYSRRMYSEDDVLALYDAMVYTHRGRPRKDGMITPNANLPTKAELISRLKQSDVMYYKDTDGEFRPVWKQPEW